MNLADFAPGLSAELAVKVSPEGEIVIRRAAELKTGIQHVEAVFPYAQRGNYSGHYSEETKTLETIHARMTKEYDNTRAAILKDTLTLPEALRGKDTDVLTMVARSPKIPLAGMRDLVDKLGFLIMPFEYLDSRSYEREGATVQASIRSFYGLLSPWFNIYAVAPVAYYDVNRHVKAELDKPIYASSMVGQAFMAVSMMLPMFRSMLGNVDQLRKESDAMAKQLAHMQTELKNLSLRVGELEKQLARQQQEALEREASTRKQIREMAAAERAFMAYEPMLLALPKGVNDNTPAIVGPCWGPDFEDVVVKALGYSKVEGQRNYVSESALRWGKR